MVGVARQRHEFRASWWVRAAVVLALSVWIGVLIWAAWLGALDPRSLAGVLFFVAFFVLFTRYYWRMMYVLDDSGVTVRRGPGGPGRHFPWESIEAVRRSSVPLGGWEVLTKRGVFVLDVFVGGRARLLDVIVARTGLFPLT